MFQGFSPESIEFLWGIRFNNERSWFEGHKQQYIDLIQQPLKELGVELQREVARRLKKQNDYVLEGDLYRRPKGEKGMLLNPWYNRRSIALAWDRPCEGSLFERHLLEEIADGVDFLMPFYDYFSTL